MAITWSVPGRPFYVTGACSSGNLAGSVTPSGSDGLDMTGAAWSAAFGPIGNYAVTVAAHDGSTALGAGNLRCWVKVAGTWSAYPTGDLTVAGGSASEAVGVINPGPVDAVAYVPDTLGAQATDITLLGSPYFQVLTLDTAGSTPNDYGMSLSDSGILNLQPADGTHPGILSTDAQTIAGAKTFADDMVASGTLTVAGALTAQSTLALTGALTASSNITAGGWLKMHSGTPYAENTLSAAEVALNNGTTDAPGLHFYVGHNTNMGVDATAASGLRIISNLDETGGAVAATISAAGDVTAVRNIIATNAVYPKGSVGCAIYAGSGTPEAAVTAAVGSIYLRSDGGAATSIYVKESGSGNTGWVAK